MKWRFFQCSICFYFLLGIISLGFQISYGVVNFTQVPPSVLYVSNGGTAKFVWDYHVDDRDNEFYTSSPEWSFINNTNNHTTLIAAEAWTFENGGMHWKWSVAPSCPARLQNRVSKESTATLVINNVNMLDNGNYSCKLVLSGGKSPIERRSKLIVTVSPQFNSQPPQTKNIIEGENLILPCTAIGPPTPNITWVKIVGHVIKNTGTGSATLRIPNIKRGQSGAYECQAWNNPNEKSVTVQTLVTVYYKPVILKELSSKNDSSWNGRKVTLKCIANGLPKPNITWYNPNSQQITEDVRTIANGSQVTITTGEENVDYGWYECQAKNIAGTANLSIFVIQLFPPGPPNATILEEDIQASSVIVRWNIPGYDGGSPIIDYKVQINNTKQPHGQNTTNVQHQLTDLTKNTRYEVKVSARNKVGYGNASITIFTTKKKGPPPLPELHVNKSETLVILYWTKPDENGGEINKYTIYRKIVEANEWTHIHVVTDLSKLMFKVRLLDLERGRTYWFIVTATNEFGESERSEEDRGKEVYISPEVTTTTPIPTTTGFVPGKDERKSTADQTNPVVIAGAVGAVVLFVIAAVIAVIILRKKNVFGGGIAKNSRPQRAAYHNEIDPDSVTQRGAAGTLGTADDGIPTYAAVEVSKKKRKGREIDIPNYAAVDKSKKKRPGEIIYAELADLNTSGAAAAATPRPITYTGTDYADISQFQKQDEPEPTYANFPGRKHNFSNVQGM